MRRLKWWQVGAVCTAMFVGVGSVSAEPASGQPEDSAGTQRPEAGDSSVGAADSAAKDAKASDDGAQHRAERRDRMRQRMFEALFRDIELTPDQRERVDAAMETWRASRKAWMAEHREQFREAVRAMREAKQADDQAAVDTAKAELTTLMETSPKLRVASDAILRVLTEDQKESFNRNVAELQKRFEHRREDRPRKRGGDGENVEAPARDAGDAPDAG